MSADHWGFVAAAYGLAAVVLAAYWRRLVRLERELDAPRARARRDRDRAVTEPITRQSR